MAQATPKQFDIIEAPTIEAALSEILRDARSASESADAKGSAARMALATIPGFFKSLHSLRHQLKEAGKPVGDDGTVEVTESQLNETLNAICSTITSMFSLTAHTLIQRESERVNGDTCPDCRRARDKLYTSMALSIARAATRHSAESKERVRL